MLVTLNLSIYRKLASIQLAAHGDSCSWFIKHLIRQETTDRAFSKYVTQAESLRAWICLTLKGKDHDLEFYSKFSGLILREL